MIQYENVKVKKHEVDIVKIKIGKQNSLKVDRLTSVGAFLEVDGAAGDILLPKKDLPEELKEGDTVNVFVYRDSEDRLIATMNKPLGEVGDMLYLKVVDVTPIGAFMDWGMAKDLFLPIREQTIRVKLGRGYLVKIYIDKSDRLCATMRIDDALTTGGEYKPGDSVQGTVYSVNPTLGVFVAIEDKYYGFVHNSEKYKDYQIGDQDTFRVVRVREDGRVDLSTKQLAHQQMDIDAEEILQLLKYKQGFLPLNDKSDPEDIKRYFSMSKNAFKRAIGRLLKEKKIQQAVDGIRLMNNE